MVGRKAPRTEPIVEIEETLPETSPAFEGSFINSLTANGEVIANNVTGMLNNTSVPANDPRTTPRLSMSKAAAAWRKTGPAINGTIPSVNAPQARILYKVSAPGDLSAQ